MNKEEKIEEMAKTLCSDYGDCKKCSLSNHECETTCAVYDDCERLYNAGYRKQSEVAREIDDLRRYIILNEDIALKCKQENGEKNEEYWKGKLSAFKQIRAYIDAELKKKYTEEQK